MKTLIIPILFIPLLSMGQRNYFPATLFFHDGDELEVLLKFPISSDRQKELKFKDSEKSRQKKIALEEIIRFNVYLEEKVFKFHVDKYEIYAKKGKIHKSKSPVISYILEECDKMSIYQIADEYRINYLTNELGLIGRTNGQAGDFTYFTHLLHRDNEYPFYIFNIRGLSIGYKKRIKNSKLYYFRNNQKVVDYINGNKKVTAMELYRMVCN